MENCCGQVNFIRRWKMSWCTANKKWNISNLEILNLQSHSENLTYHLSKQMYIDPCLYHKGVFALVLPENPWFSYWIGKLVNANWGSVNTSGGSMNTNGGSVNTNEGSVSVILQLYFHYIVNVIIIGGGNQTTQRNPSTCPKWMTNFTT